MDKDFVAPALISQSYCCFRIWMLVASILGATHSYDPEEEEEDVPYPLRDRGNDDLFNVFIHMDPEALFRFLQPADLSLLGQVNKNWHELNQSRNLNPLRQG